MATILKRFLFCLFVCCHVHLAFGQSDETLRIESVLPLAKQPQENKKTTIWYDDFNGKPKHYAEGGNSLDSSESLGGRGKSLRCFYKKGTQGSGGLKFFFGDSPAYPNQAIRSDETFDEVFWRIYVKHQPGWKGPAGKMSRATSLVDTNWAQAMIAHVWSGSGDSITLDPVSCIEGKTVRTKHYNDWKGMKWLGNRPVSKFPIHATKESGRWICVECRVKLNTPGKSDGINQLWIDRRLECERRNLDFRGNYTEHGINAIFLEAYWNEGSPVTQTRWYDNFVVATERIGPVVCPANPIVVRSVQQTEEKQNDAFWQWQIEIAEDTPTKPVLFASRLLPASERKVRVDAAHGQFLGEVSGKKSLMRKKQYCVRIRHFSMPVGSRSESEKRSTKKLKLEAPWSDWHQAFRVGK